MHEVCSDISTQDFLTTISQWSSIVNKQLCNSTSMVQQYGNIIDAFEEQKQLLTFSNKDT